MHHLHMRTRETNNRFRCHEKQRPTSYHPTPYSRLDAKELTRFALGTTERELFHGQIASLTLGVSMPPSILSLILLSRILTMTILIGIFLLPYFASQELLGLFIYAPSPFFCFFSLGPKDSQI